MNMADEEKENQIVDVQYIDKDIEEKNIQVDT